MKYDKYKIGERINKERCNRGMTQQDLVDKCHEITGLENPPFSVRAFGSWENGNDSITLKNLILISQALECSVGYLLSEYDKRTLEIEDICNVTGLSEEAVKVLQKEAARIQEINKCNTIKTGFISCLLESGTGIFDTLSDFMQHETDMKEIKRLQFYGSIEEAFSEAKEKNGCLAFDDETGECFIQYSEELFYSLLKKKLETYYASFGSNDEIEKMVKEGDVLFADKSAKDRFLEKIKKVDLVRETMELLEFGCNIYKLLEIEQKKKYFKYEMSDNFMDIVKAYVKEGAEDGRKDKLQEER